MTGMTCRQFDEVVHGFVRMELLDVELRDAALDHVAGCAECRERMAEASVLAAATVTASTNAYGQQAPPSVETAVLAAFRKYHRRAGWRRTFEWAAVGAVAAMALVFVWTVAGRSKGQLSPAPGKNVSSQSREPLDARDAGPLQPEKAVPATETEEAGAVTGETVAAENFVLLPDADQVGSQDLGMVVHVQLTRASLAELGYPVTDTPDDDLISADVLVGEDGWPRAVKLVQ